MPPISLVQTRVGQVRVGLPQHHRRLTIFPLLAPPVGVVYTTLGAALAAKTVEVREHSQETVPSLLLINHGAQAVFLLDGEEVVGGHQNRIVTASALIRPGARLALPVNCVEQGRWRPASATFRPGETSHAALRAISAQAVGASLRHSGQPAGDQRAVWREVSRKQATLAAPAPTQALNDVYSSQTDHLADYARALPPVAGACGLAVAIAGRLVALDLFNQPALAAAYWPRLVRSAALDALDATGPDAPAPRSALENLLVELAAASVTTFPSLDLGLDARLSTPHLAGAGLLHDETVVHLSAFPRTQAAADQPTTEAIGRVARPTQRSVRVNDLLARLFPGGPPGPTYRS